MQVEKESNLECWFGEGGYLKSSKWRGELERLLLKWGTVNPANPIYRNKPGSKLDDNDYDDMF